jgi:hypothetical protein
MGLVSGGGGRALIICPSFVREFGRHEAAVSVSRSSPLAPWAPVLADEIELGADVSLTWW